MPNFVAMQLRAHRQISRFGGTAQLRRGGVDRDVTAGTVSHYTADREGSLIQYGDKRVLISGYSLIGKEPPDPEVDSLKLNGVEYKIIAPGSTLATDEKTVLFWEVAARR